MKIRSGFVSNSSSSSFLFNNNFTLDEIKYKVEKLADINNIDTNGYKYIIIDENTILENENYYWFDECDELLENSYDNEEYWELSKEISKVNKERQIEISNRLIEIREEINLRNKINIINWIKSDDFQNNIKGKIWVIGGENDRFIYEFMSKYFNDDGYHMHLG